MKKWFLKSVMILSIATLNSCASKKTDHQKEDKFDFSNLKIPENTQKKLQEQFQTVQKQIHSLWSQLVEKSRGTTVNLKQQVAFQTVESNAGFFYISSQGLDKFQDGYRLKLKIGNPLAADFSNLTVRIKWGGLSTNEDKKKGKKIEEIHLDELTSSSWKIIETVLSPVDSEDEIEKVNIEIAVEQVNLNRK